MRRALAVVLASLLTAAACADGDTAVDEGASREVPEVVDLGASPATAERVTLRLAVPRDVSADPADAGPASLATRVLADLRYEGLARIASDGRAEPALADRWFVSEDRLTWTFLLPPDLVDANGERLTARDVKRSLERVAARGPADQAATALVPVRGWSDHMNGLSGGVAGIVATDETTLVIVLDTVYELLPDVLASPAYGISEPLDDGSWRITGEYVPADDGTQLQARDPDAVVERLDLVPADDGVVDLVGDGSVDWAVLAPGESAAGLPADVTRRPLELEVAVAVRLTDAAKRTAVHAALAPLLLAAEVDGLLGSSVSRPETDADLPEAVTVDVPAGALVPVGEAIARQLEDAGVEVTVVRNGAEAFADRVAAGDARIFPIIIAGGIGPEGGLLRVAMPGGVDDLFGPADGARAELAAAIVAEIDVEQRTLFARALERTLIDDGLLLPVGRFEVLVAMGRRLDGLVHRPDGTLDLSSVTVAEPA